MHPAEASIREAVRALPAFPVPSPLSDSLVAAAVAALPEAQAEVVALRIDGGLSFEEIAAVIDTNPNTAASRYRSALEKLRLTLGAAANLPRHPVRP
jgi:RNA polymerase sigma-70 factor (ECF subfamily)